MFAKQCVYRVKSLNEFKGETDVPDGLTLLFDDELNPIMPMNAFIIDHASGACPPYNTSNSYSDDLANWVVFCDLKGIKWWNANISDLKVYEHILASSVSVITRRPFSASTISRRIGTVKEYYRYCVREGVIEDDNQCPHHYAKKWKIGGKDRAVKFIELEAMKDILDALGPDPGATSPPMRDRTVATLLFIIGGRLEDAFSLKLTDVFNWEQEIKSRPSKFLVEHTVNGKNGTRTVLVPRALVNLLVRYVETTRADIVQKTLERKGTSWRPSNQVFLNSTNSNYKNAGQPCTKDTLGRAFVSAVRRAGLLVAEEKIVLTDDDIPLVEKGVRIVEITSRPKHTIHHLRHTFAGVAADALRKYGHKDPLKIVQILLGHAWLSTTADTYARPLALDEPDISDAYEAVLRSLDMHREDDN